MFLLLSLVCSAISELVAQALGMRSANMVKWLRQVIKTPEDIKKFYDSPLIKSLTIPKPDPSNLVSKSFSKIVDRFVPERGKPSYVPARTFALTLMNLGNDFPDGQMKDALLYLMKEAKDDSEKLRANIEEWYDGAMDRVSGWYKRKTQVVLLVIAVVVAVTLNADSFEIGDRLWRDDALRTSVAEAAQTLIDEDNAAVTTPDGDAATTPDANAAATPDAKVVAALAEVEDLGIPLGWDWDERPRDLQSWLTKLGGLIFTALALSLGAPFWFDALNKVVNLRGSGKPPVVEKKEGT